MKPLIFAIAATGLTWTPGGRRRAGSGPTDLRSPPLWLRLTRSTLTQAHSLSPAQSADVKTFAQRMITDHTGVNKAATELVQKLHVTPAPNPTSESLQKGGDENLAALKKLSGAAFDKAYVDHEVAYHEAVLSAVDKTLIPSAQNAELKALLVKVRPAFVAHLEHAKQLQSALAKGG